VAKGVLMGLWGGVLALAIFFLARRGWLASATAGLGVMTLLWLGATLSMSGNWLAAGAVVAADLALFLVAARKCPLPRGFLPTFTTLFLILFGAGAIATALLPNSYCSAVRLKVSRSVVEKPGEPPAAGLVSPYDPYFIQTEFEVLQSTVILNQVVQELNLEQVWSKRIGQPLSNAEVLGLLRRQLDFRLVRNTSLIEIRAYSNKPEEAAEIANALARVYAHHVNEVRGAAGGVEVVDQAVPGLRPVRPNKPANLAVAAIAGFVIGVAGGAARARRPGL
jgi:uncharacterized protein involved in exopolysaccharide biosynthesis